MHAVIAKIDFVLPINITIRLFFFMLENSFKRLPVQVSARN